MEETNTRYTIRFRAWNRDTRELYKWDCYEDYPLKGMISTCPQEFTGFYDKNDQEIYVGDIVNYLEDNYLVRFLDGSYIFYKLENISTLKFYWFNSLIEKKKEMQIVGNTFENAEYITECLNKNNINDPASIW